MSKSRYIVLAVIALLGAAAIYLLGVRGVDFAEDQEAPFGARLTQSALREEPARELDSAQNLCLHFHETVCKSKEGVEDPTGTVQPDVRGEVEALRLYEKIIHEHPGWTSDQVDESLVKVIYTEKRRARLMELFAWVQLTMTRLIDRQPASVITAKSKQMLVAQIQSTVLELPPPASLYAGELDLFTKNDVFYETLKGGRSVIRIGGAYLLTAKSKFNRVFTFAHELAHSIDPCELENRGLKLPGYAKLVRCFVKHGMIHSKSETSACGADEQVREVFADWIATQVELEALKEMQPAFQKPTDLVNSVINSVRDLCDPESWLEYDNTTHPGPKTRIEIIFGRNPAIRQLLGCRNPSPDIGYCTFEGG